MDHQFILSLITSVFIGGAAGYLGSLMLTKRMVLVAGPLGHLTLPGIALALLYGFDVSLGAFPFVILGIVLIWLFELRTKLSMESLTAIVFAFGVAVTFLFLPIERAETALVGDISMVRFWEMVAAIILSVSVLLVVRKIFPKMTLINISEELAKVEGVNIKKYNLVYLVCVAVVIALSVKIVGGLLTAALVAIPAAAARNFGINLLNYSILALVFGVISAVLGILLGVLTSLSAGPLIILVGVFIFLISSIYRRAY